MDGGSASEIVTNAIATMQADVTTVIPAALGISVLLFGATFLWRKVKGLMG